VKLIVVPKCFQSDEGDSDKENRPPYPSTPSSPSHRACSSSSSSISGSNSSCFCALCLHIDEVSCLSLHDTLARATLIVLIFYQSSALRSQRRTRDIGIAPMFLIAMVSCSQDALQEAPPAEDALADVPQPSPPQLDIHEANTVPRPATPPVVAWLRDTPDVQPTEPVYDPRWDDSMPDLNRPPWRVRRVSINSERLHHFFCNFHCVLIKNDLLQSIYDFPLGRRRRPRQFSGKHWNCRPQPQNPWERHWGPPPPPPAGAV